MPSLTPLSETTETLGVIADATETLSTISEGAETLAEIDELTAIRYVVYPQSTTYPSSTTYPGDYSTGMILDLISEATETLTPMTEI